MKQKEGAGEGGGGGVEVGKGPVELHMPVITVTTKGSSAVNILSGRHERKHLSVRCQHGGRG